MSNEIMNNAANEEEELDTLTLCDEEGNEIEFELMDVIEYDGNEYAVLLPLESPENDGVDEVVILLVESETEEEQFFAAVEDREVEIAVFEIFKEKNKDILNFVDVD